MISIASQRLHAIKPCLTCDSEGGDGGCGDCGGCGCSGSLHPAEARVTPAYRIAYPVQICAVLITQQCPRREFETYPSRRHCCCCCYCELLRHHADRLAVPMSRAWLWWQQQPPPVVEHTRNQHCNVRNRRRHIQHTGARRRNRHRRIGPAREGGRRTTPIAAIPSAKESRQ